MRGRQAGRPVGSVVGDDGPLDTPRIRDPYSPKRAQTCYASGTRRWGSESPRVPYYHEHIDAPHCQFVTQKMIDYYHLTGPAEEICRRIQTRGRLGVRTVSATVFTVVDKRVMRRISEEIMPAFRH